jgi:hypothetical protein
MGTVDEPECLCAQAAPLFVGKPVALLAGSFANGFPINLLGNGGLFHLRKYYSEKGGLPRLSYFTEFTSGARP